MVNFIRTPLCEECESKTATLFCSFEDDRGKFLWYFSCDDCERPNEIYEIEISHFFKSPSATVDWLSHLHEKTWMNWSDFMEMMYRFRAATNSYMSTS